MPSLSVRRLTVTLFTFSVLGAAFQLSHFLVFCRGDPRFPPSPPSPYNLAQRYHFLSRPNNSESDDMTEQKSSAPIRRFNVEDDEDDSHHDTNDYCEVVDEFGALAAERFCEAKDETGGDFRWIRLEKQLDKSLQSVRTERDVLDQIRLATEEQAKYGNAALFTRRWKHLKHGILNGVNDDESDDSSSSFTVLQFNVLAEGLSAGPDATCPFTIVNDYYGRIDKNTYGGFTDVEQPETVLNFSLRRWRLLEVILGNQGTCPFDIVALEEVDRYYGFFSPMMRIFGYEGVFIPKSASPGVRMGWYSDGCALFWKKDMFELISERRVEYKVGNQVLLLAVLRHCATKNPLLVAVTHLKAQKSETNEMIRCTQVEEIVVSVKEDLAVLSEAFKTATVPVLILGDFNADAPPQTEGTYSAIRTLLNSNVSPNHAPCSLQSAYEVDPPTENFYTTWKTRGTSTTRRIIDYILYGGNLSCRANLAVPEADELGEAKLPSFRHPSDHMSIAAKFDLT